MNKSIRYQEFLPIKPLASYIECFWIIESPLKTQANRILPDGCMEIVFNFAEKCWRHHENDEIEVQSRTLLIGQMKKLVLIEPSGKVRWLGVHFKPGGAYPFFQFPISQITNHVLSLDSIWMKREKKK